MTQKVFEQSIFLRRELDLLVASIGEVRDHVQHEISALELRRLFRTRPAQDASQPRRQFLEMEGLGEIVVGTEVESLYTILRRATSREHQNGCGIARIAQRTEHGIAVELRQHHVQHDGVEMIVHRKIESRLAIGDGFHDVPFLFKATLDEAGDLAFVFDNQYSHGSKIQTVRYLDGQMIRYLPHLVFLLAVAIQLARVLDMCGGAFAYALDDAEIHMAVAREIASGHYGLAPDTVTTPASSILWPVLLAPFMYLPIAFMTPFVMGCVIGTAIAESVRRLLSVWVVDETLTALLASGIVLLTNQAGLPFLGMEHGLHVLLSLILLYAVATSGKAAPSAWIAVVMALTPAIRYEGLALTGLTAIVLWWRGYRTTACLGLGGAILVLGTFSLFLAVNGLGWLPSSVLVKSFATGADNGNTGLWNNIVLNVSGGSGRALLVASVFSVIIGIVMRRTPLGITALVVAVITLAQIVAGRTGWFTRYDVMAWTLLACVLVAAAWTVHRSHRTIAAGLAAVVLLCAYPFLTAAKRLPAVSLNQMAMQEQMARFALMWKRPVAVNDIGAVAYHARGAAVDLWGLDDVRIARRRIGTRNGTWMDSLCSQRGADVVWIYSSWFPHRPATWIRLGSLGLVPPAGNPLSGVDSVDVYVRDPRRIPEVRTALDTWKTGLPDGAEWRPSF